MWNVKFNHKTCFLNLFIKTKNNEQTKQNKTKLLLRYIKVFNLQMYLLGGEAANGVNFMQHMLVSYLSCYF